MSDEIDLGANRHTFRARVVDTVSAARAQWTKPALPTAATPPADGWTPLHAGDVYHVKLRDHSEMTFTGDHDGMKWVIVARDVASFEVQIPVFIAGRHQPSKAWMREAARRDDFVLLPPTHEGGPKFCGNKDIIVDCTKAPTLLRGRFEPSGKRGSRYRGSIGPVWLTAIRDAHMVGMQLAGLGASSDAVEA